MANRKALPSVPSVRCPIDRLPFALNAASFERAKHGAWKDSGASLEYLATAANEGATGWHLATGDAIAHGFDIAGVPVAFVARFQGIAHEQRALAAMVWNANAATSKQKASDAKRFGDLATNAALGVIAYNVRRAVSQHRASGTLAATLCREHRTVSPVVIAAILGDAESISPARDIVREVLRRMEARDALRYLRMDLRERGFRFTL
jgi:hypothetical protein